jgi:5-methylcytosine-specific restriction endonuclease McrA
MRDDVFDNLATKTVTKTDKAKGAYVLNEAQRAVLEAAGKLPGKGGDNAIRFDIDVPNDLSGLQLSVSYYDSIRVGAGRTPEARMGRDIVRWMEIGDSITLGNIGTSIFAWKNNAPKVPVSELAGSIADTANKTRLIEKAGQAAGKPPRLTREISDFQRSTAVVVGALARADGLCEMPDCKRDTFLRADGTVFLEVHHITPLAEEGEDTLLNAAALCPTCHRELHYGARKLALRERLRLAVQAKTKP